MHDLRLSPAEQMACGDPAAPGGPTTRGRPTVDYFRRGPRPEEVFFVVSTATACATWCARSSRTTPPGARSDRETAARRQLRRTLTLWDLVFYGIVLIQPTAPMGIFGVVSQEARGHVVTTILIGMVAMLLTARQLRPHGARVPERRLGVHVRGPGASIPALGYVTGWSMVMDYVLNPIICTILCTKLTMNYLPLAAPPGRRRLLRRRSSPCLNLRGIKASARTNQVIGIGLGVVVLVFLGAAAPLPVGRAAQRRGPDAPVLRSGHVLAPGSC